LRHQLLELCCVDISRINHSCRVHATIISTTLAIGCPNVSSRTKQLLSVGWIYDSQFVQVLLGDVFNHIHAIVTVLCEDLVWTT
jgi:hypothetical protein